MKLICKTKYDKPSIVKFNKALYYKTRNVMKPSDLCEIKISPVNIGISLITKLEIDQIEIGATKKPFYSTCTFCNYHI